MLQMNMVKYIDDRRFSLETDEVYENSIPKGEWKYKVQERIQR